MLNDRLLEAIGRIEGQSVLELGAGNGYFLPLALRRFSGQAPARLTITDQSQALLGIAQSSFAIDSAEYLTLDVQTAFPFADATFDLILAAMLFNELPTSSLHTALLECHRVLKPGGRLIAAVPHPTFIHALAKQGVLTDFGRGLFAMPSAEGLKLPVSRRSVEKYEESLRAADFTYALSDVLPDAKTLHDKPAMRLPRATPLAFLLECDKVAQDVAS